MIHAADAFVKNVHKLPPFHGNPFYWHAQALVDELQLMHLEQDLEKVLGFALFANTRIQQSKIISHSIMALSITSICLSEYWTRANQRSGQKSRDAGDAYPAED